ncbi:MAG: zinc-finger domain-containing protein [Burkholderiaceae bacterium]|nr:zinc-finger domain-containing protein [Burkholderiaceae bacterium]
MSTNPEAAASPPAPKLNAEGGVYCPNPQAGMALWNMHPRVYLDVVRTGSAKCPYCGAVYQIERGAQQETTDSVAPGSA